MLKNFTLTGSISLCTLLFSPTQIFSQTITASPENIIRPVGANNVSVFLDRVSGGWSGSGNYNWTVSPSTGVTIGSYSQSGSAAGDVTATFSSAASGSYIFTLTKGTSTASVVIKVGTIAATSSTGNTISSFSVTNGIYSSGPDKVFTPGIQSAALGLSNDGYYYYLPNNYFGNDGNVTVYAAKPDGSGKTAIGSIDMNGSSNNDLGFVRLAIDQTGTGWILAGDNQTLYLGKFTANGVNPTTISVIDPSVALINGSVATFYNGDICVSGNGTLFALANSGGGGITQIFVGTPNGTNTTLNKKWDLVNQNGSPFTGSVNGVAFDILGSLYISTSTGLYYINQYTVNTATGTVQCSLVSNVTGLTDLASNAFPLLSALPVKLVSFSGIYRNEKATLTWQTEDESNFSYFEIERSGNGNDYSLVSTRTAAGTLNGRQTYQYTDDLSMAGGTAFMYRLKMVDADGQFKYSNVIMIKKETSPIKQVSLNPNPVTNGMATVRFAASSTGSVEFRIADLSGRIILQQQNAVQEGNNSISLNHLDRLQTGNYVLLITDGTESSSVKFTVVK